MGNREIKQQARRAALDAQTKRREAGAARERRLERLAVQVLVAIRERDAAVLDADRRAGEALTEMVDTEGLSARDAAQWCGKEVSTREVARLRRVAADAVATHEEGAASTRTAARRRTSRRRRSRTPTRPRRRRQHRDPVSARRHRHTDQHD